MSHVRRPGQTILFVEECERRSYLMNSFMATASSWVDFVAINHRIGDTYSFVDGHSEFWKYEDPRTMSVDTFSHGASGAGNTDLQRIAAGLWPAYP